MALIAIAAVQLAFDVSLTIYRLLNRPKTPLPPLRDLQIMTATNCAPVPFGYGTVRVAGNVIWSPGITYTTLGKKSNAGAALGPKGSFVFRASVAVSFGEGPGTISRIWADSKLIYAKDPTQSSAVPVSDWPIWSPTELYNPGNQVGYVSQVWQCLVVNTNSAPSQSNANWEIVSSYPPWNSSTEYLAGDVVSYFGQIYVAQLASNNGTVGAFTPGNGDTESVGNENVLYWIALTALYPAPTFYPGDENQLPDSLIQASETVALTPAFRGLVYTVWENFPLTNFADRIPSFRAEVTYTRTDNLLTSATSGAAGAAYFQSSTFPAIVEVKSGDTIVVIGGTFASGLGIAVSDSLGDSFTLLLNSGPAANEAPRTQIWYVHAGGGADCNAVTVSVSGQDWASIYILPGSWTPGVYAGFQMATSGATSATQNLASTVAGSVGIAGAGHLQVFHPNGILRPFNLTETLYAFGKTASGGGPGQSTAHASIIAQLGAPANYPITDTWNEEIIVFPTLDNGEGGAGGWAEFKPPSPVPPSCGPPQPPDVLHDICERAGLLPAQIDNSLCVAPNIITPMSPPQAVLGFLIDHPTPAATILKTLMTAYFFDSCETNGTMKFVPRGMAAALTIPEIDLGLLADMAKIEEQIAQEQDLPKQFTVTHNDPTLDYQSNKQLKGRNVRIVKTKQQTILEIPMTMTAEWARQTAEKALYLSWLERSSYKLNLWRAIYLLLDPTDVLGFVYETLAFQMRVSENSIGQGRAVALQGVSEFAEMFISLADGGVALGMPASHVQLLATTLLFLFDIPLLRDVDSNPQNTGFYYGLSSPLLTWNGGVLFDSTDDVNFLQESASSRPVTFGYATTVLGAPVRSPWIWDTVNTLTVKLVRGSFAGDTMLNVLNGSNALLVGSELIQFTTAVQNADGSWTLSGLLRGRRGTEWACGTHAAGDLVVMPSTGVVRMQDPLAIVGQLHYKKGVTSGQDPSTVPPVNFTVVGNDLKPYAPWHIAGTRDGSNNLTVTWIRRTRVGWLNLSQDPVPLSEDSEAYSVDILNGSTVVRTITAGSPTAGLLTETFVADGSTNVFTLTTVPPGAILWYRNGLLQSAPDDYSRSGRQITVALSAGTISGDTFTAAHAQGSGNVAGSPAIEYSAADQTADFGSPQASVSMKVYQLSAQIGRGFAGVAAV